MSALVSRDPLVVNTRDGAVWQRRAVTADGHGLYAVTGSCRCPEYLMATLAELAKHGIVGSADVLPVPVGPEPSEPKPIAYAKKVTEAQLLLAHPSEKQRAAEWPWDMWCRICLIRPTSHRTEAEALEGADQHVKLYHAPAAEVHKLMSSGGLAELERLRARVAELRADRADEHDELAMALGHSNGTEWGDLIEFAAGAVSVEARLRARVAELESERLVTNEALSDAAEQLRADQDRLAELEAWKAADEKVQPHRQAIGAANMRMIGVLELRIRRVRMLHSRGWGAESERCEHDGEPWPCKTLAALDAAVGEAKRESDGLTRTFAPTQALPLTAGAAHVAPCRWPSSPECTCGGGGS